MRAMLVPHSISERTEWHSGDHNDPDWAERYWAVDFVFGVARAREGHHGGKYVSVGGEIRGTRGNDFESVKQTLKELGFSKEEIAEACDLKAAEKFKKMKDKQREILDAEREMQRAEERLRKAKQ